MKKSFVTHTVLILLTAALWSQNYNSQLIYSDDDYADQMESMNRVDEENAVIYSKSYINWTKHIFNSEISLDLQKADIPMPAGKSSAVNKIQTELPLLIKDPLLSIYVDDTQTLAELVLQKTFTLEQLTEIISNGKQTPSYFAQDGNNLLTSHSIKLEEIGSPLVKHKSPYTLRAPIEHIASRAYSGIIIDARGKLPIHGDFNSAEVEPCLFPKVYSEDMDLLYERNMVDPEIAKNQNIVYYDSNEDISAYRERIGRDPLWITARQVFGINKCDPVISHSDYLKITTVPENLELLRKGKVVILLNKEQLVHGVSAPDKNKKYYINYQKLRRYFIERKVPEIVVLDAPAGIQISIQDLKFAADSAELLDEETERIAIIAQSLKQITASNEYTILVEGHTADVNKPKGQMELSIERALAIINALVAEGVNQSLFTYKGYGGTMPVADNSTAEGRAQNRRVELTVMPKSSFVQKR